MPGDIRRSDAYIRPSDANQNVPMQQPANQNIPLVGHQFQAVPLPLGQQIHALLTNVLNQPAPVYVLPPLQLPPLPPLQLPPLPPLQLPPLPPLQLPPLQLQPLPLLKFKLLEDLQYKLKPKWPGQFLKSLNHVDYYTTSFQRWVFQWIPDPLREEDEQEPAVKASWTLRRVTRNVAMCAATIFTSLIDFPKLPLAAIEEVLIGCKKSATALWKGEGITFAPMFHHSNIACKYLILLFWKCVYLPKEAVIHWPGSLVHSEKCASAASAAFLGAATLIPQAEDKEEEYGRPSLETPFPKLVYHHHLV